MENRLQFFISDLLLIMSRQTCHKFVAQFDLDRGFFSANWSPQVWTVQKYFISFTMLTWFELHQVTMLLMLFIGSILLLSLFNTDLFKPALVVNSCSLHMCTVQLFSHLKTGQYKINNGTA